MRLFQSTGSQRIDGIDVDDVLDVFGWFDVGDGADDEPIEWFGFLGLQNGVVAIAAVVPAPVSDTRCLVVDEWSAAFLQTIRQSPRSQ